MIQKDKKVWFITGASKGFGFALVKLLLSNGNRVAATSRNAADIERQIVENRENLLPLTVDITNEESVKTAIDQTIEKFGRLDVVVNNAGYGLLGSLEEVTGQEFRQSMEVNVFGTVHVIRAVMPYLRAQGSGHIFNISSSGGYYGVGNGGSYTAAKFAVVGLSEALAQEAKAFGVKVTVVAPGYFRTSFLDKGSIRITNNRVKEYNTDQLEETLKQMEGNQPGDPDKLVAALVGLAEEPNPPVHLLMGPDAYQAVSDKRKLENEEFETWKHITLSTNFDN
jgi:NAD(P)-dependent dehydrogenase (short-subunit alcohol dehydrogenase family)